MSKADYPYPDDEFDATDPATPLGVHRAPRTWWSRWWPFVVVLLVAPVVAFLAVTWAADQDSASTGTDNPTTSAPAASEEPSASETASTPAEEPSETPAETPEETASEEPAAEPDLAASVLVLNGSGISGLAGRTGEDLESAGFTNVSTGNYSGDADASTVYYASEELKATADQVAQTIGVDAVVLDAGEAGDAVTVVLITDPDA